MKENRSILLSMFAGASIIFLMEATLFLVDRITRPERKVAALKPSQHRMDIDIAKWKAMDEMERRETFLVVMLGSSVVHGANISYEKTFTSRLQQTRPGKKVFYVNAGHVGMKVHRQLHVYKKAFEALKPDLVVWFPNRNDFFSTEVVKAAQDDKQRASKITSYQIKDWASLRQISSLGARYSKWVSEQDGKNPFSRKDWYYTHGLREPIDEGMQESLLRTMIEFRSYLKAQGTELAVVFVPSRLFSHLYSWEDAEAFKHLSQMFGNMQVEWKEVFSDFESQGNLNSFIDDVHFSESGHNLVANVLGEWIVAQLP